MYFFSTVARVGHSVARTPRQAATVARQKAPATATHDAPVADLHRTR